MIKPTIGRVVWFGSAAMRNIHPDPQPWPALICFVHDDRLVNVAGFMSNGETFRAEDVQLLQDDDAIPNGTDFAMWMPYQVSAAAKDATASEVKTPAPDATLLTPAPAPVPAPVPAAEGAAAPVATDVPAA